MAAAVSAAEMTRTSSAPAGPVPAAPVLELRMLGTALVREPGGPVLTGLGVKGLALLSYLALQPGQAAPRDSLVDLLWSQGSPDQGRASLRQELRRMKRALGPLFEQVIETPGGQIALRAGAVVSDYALAMEACEARDTAGLSALLDLYGGAFLAPLSVSEIAFQDWVAGRNSHLEAVVLDALLRLMLLDESAGRLERAASAARALLAIDSLQEDVHAALIRLHVAAGRISQARRQAETARLLFLEELGEPPETDLAALIPEGRAARSLPAPAEPSRRGPGPDRPAPARPVSNDSRPLLALAPGGEAGEAGDMARAAVESAFEPLRRMSWLRVADGVALLAAGSGPLSDAADYAVTLRVTPGATASAEIVTAARRGDPAAAAARRLCWPAGTELSTPVGLGRLLAGAISSELMELETQLEQSGDDDWSRLMRARALLMRGGPRAAETLRALLEPEARAGESSTPALCLLALSHLEEGWSGWSEAPREAVFRGRELALRALRRAPGDPWPQHVQGIAASLMGDPAAARAHQLRALELAPGFAPAIGETARLLALDGDVEEADAWAARALQIAPGAAEAAYWRRAPALARFALGDWEGALKATETALAVRPDWVQTRLLKAACLRALKRGPEAEAALADVAGVLDAMSPEAVMLGHPFVDADRVRLLLG